MIAPLLGMLLAISLLWQHLVSGRDLAILGGMYVVTALGITVGYHRMLTHRSFEAHPVVRFVFLVFGSMALQGPPLDWASIHIEHHAHTDTDDDPRSPLAGFFHAHLGWLVTHQQANPAVYGTWLLKDRLVMAVSKTFVVWTVLGFVIPYLLGGWTGVLWGGLVRIFLLNHVTWSVNSVCHTFGTRLSRPTTRAATTGWSGCWRWARAGTTITMPSPLGVHGLRWWQFDLSALVIRALERLGLVWKVVRVPAARLAARTRPAPSR